MFYLVKSPWLLKKWYARREWDVPTEKAGAGGDPAKTLYLTFDDGPHPVVTPFVLDLLQSHRAKATFFCIGKNVEEQPAIYKRILSDGHRVGNHTQNHLNGWKTPDTTYIDNVRMAAKLIDSDLYRPPYGRIGPLQAQVLRDPPFGFRIIMWDVLSADFDVRLNAATCARHVIRNGRPGSIVVFHDSEKAYDRLAGALPLVLEHFAKEGYRFGSIL